MWTTNVFYSGTFIQNYNVQLTLGENGIPAGWNAYYEDGTPIDYWPSSPKSFTVDTSGGWGETWDVDNPDSSRFDCVYGTNYSWDEMGTYKTMTINISGYDTFTLYIRSNAEWYWDNYVMVSELDQYIDSITDKYDTSYVKAHTADFQSYGTSLEDYTLVEFYPGGGEHTITIVHVRNNDGDNQGYVLIPNDQ
jgi:hypothetical protein